MPKGEPYNIVHLDIEEKKQIKKLIKKLVSEEHIGMREWTSTTVTAPKGASGVISY